MSDWALLSKSTTYANVVSPLPTNCHCPACEMLGKKLLQKFPEMTDELKALLPNVQVTTPSTSTQLASETNKPSYAPSKPTNSQSIALQKASNPPTSLQNIPLKKGSKPSPASKPSPPSQQPPNNLTTIKYHSIYNKLCTDGEKARGGVSVIVSNNIPHKVISLNTNLQAVAIRLFLHSAVTLSFISPSTPINETNLNDLITKLPSPFRKKSSSANYSEKFQRNKTREEKKKT